MYSSWSDGDMDSSAFRFVTVLSSGKEKDTAESGTNDESCVLPM